MQERPKGAQLSTCMQYLGFFMQVHVLFEYKCVLNSSYILRMQFEVEQTSFAPFRHFHLMLDVGGGGVHACRRRTISSLYKLIIE